MRENITIIESEHLALQNQIKTLKININKKLNTIVIAVNNRSASNTITDLQAIKLTLKSQNSQKSDHIRLTEQSASHAATRANAIIISALVSYAQAVAKSSKIANT